MLPSDSDDCGECTLASGRPLRPAVALSAVPFLLTFVLVALFAWRRLFPLLSGLSHAAGNDNAFGPASPRRRPSLSLRRLPYSLHSWTRFTLGRTAALAFSTNIALSAVLAELIFCEISGLVDPVARSLALQVTITVLLVSLVLVTPLLEIHSIISSTGWSEKGAAAMAVVALFDLLGFSLWLAGFWWMGLAVLGSSHRQDRGARAQSYSGFSEGSLERIGIIGISLMASLAGFAAVSSLWQTFGVRGRRIVSETDIARKQAGLDAASDLLASKESRFRALEHKMGDMPQETFVGRLLGSVTGRGAGSDTQELSMLRLEIAGLEAMQQSLSTSLQLLHSRRSAQQASSTAFGRLCNTTSYLFSIYCMWRIGATSVATLRRWWSWRASTLAAAATTTFSSTDPINNMLALVARHWDPDIDRAAWSQQIGFALSGLMLLASFNAVLQTVLLFARFTPPRLLQSARRNLALLVSQISATYVVSSTLLLRSNLPSEMGSAIEDALGAPLDVAFVERWFEGWFLGACALTALGILFVRSVLSTGDWDDDDGIGDDVEMGKRS